MCVTGLFRPRRLARKWMSRNNIDVTAAYEALIRKIKEKTEKATSETLADFRFWQRERDQRAGEGFEEFHERVKTAARDCAFGTLGDRLIKSRLIVGILNRDPQRSLKNWTPKKT